VARVSWVGITPLSIKNILGERRKMTFPGSVPFSVKAEGGLWNNESGILGKEVYIFS
jgi:hypothetical protein